jgi:hypothetical protein
MCGFCNVWVRVCVSFVMCDCVCMCGFCDVLTLDCAATGTGKNRENTNINSVAGVKYCVIITLLIFMKLARIWQVSVRNSWFYLITIRREFSSFIPSFRRPDSEKEERLWPLHKAFVT